MNNLELRGWVWDRKSTTRRLVRKAMSIIIIRKNGAVYINIKSLFVSRKGCTHSVDKIKTFFDYFVKINLLFFI